MFGYYFEVALRSLQRNWALTVLMVLAIAIGIGASMTTLTVLYVMSGDPLPGRSEIVYYPQIDPRGSAGYLPGKTAPMDKVSWVDGMNLLRARRADYQALMTGGQVAVQLEDARFNPFYEAARYTTADFFPMFGVQFKYGVAWSAADDEASARVAVINTALNDKLFGGRDSTGQTLRLSGVPFRIVGVLGNWHPRPKFYDIGLKRYEHEGVYVPLSTSQDVNMNHDGSVECWRDGGAGKNPSHTSSCAWLQFWVQLDSSAKVDAYTRFLVAYSAEQKAQGRFERPPNVRLLNVKQWLDYNNVVPSDVRLQNWLAFGFLLVCLINAMGLMQAKFKRRTSELSVRRALGASKRALFTQLLVESGVVGMAGGLCGLMLAVLGLELVRLQPVEYNDLAHLDLAMLLTTLVLAIVTSLLAGLVPAWRACQIAPALQLKTQ
jgi:putative ABC transport system permease protein